MTDEDAKVIEASEAVVHTAAVEVKTLTIRGRQLTLSVFRQIPVRPLIVDRGDVELDGKPWGRVNYFPGDCAGKEKRGHLHVIWQDGDQLFRACVEQPSVVHLMHRVTSATYGYHLSDYSEDLTKWLAYQMARTPCSPKRPEYGSDPICLQAFELLCRYRNQYTAPSSAAWLHEVELVKGRLRGAVPDQQVTRLVAAELLKTDLYAEFSCDCDPDDCDCDPETVGQQIDDDFAKVRRLEEEHLRLYSELRHNIPQLYIAV